MPAGSVASAADPPAPDRSAVVGIDVDPPCLNVLLTACTFAAALDHGTALAGAFRMRPDFSFEPVLVEGVDVQAPPFRLTYHIKEQAVWSDGTPLTSADFVFTLDTILNPANSTLEAGYALVTQADQIDAKTFPLTFSAPYPDWRSLFPVVLPEAHPCGARLRPGLAGRDRRPGHARADRLGAVPPHRVARGIADGVAQSTLVGPDRAGPGVDRLRSCRARTTSSTASAAARST